MPLNQGDYVRSRCEIKVPPLPKKTGWGNRSKGPEEPEITIPAGTYGVINGVMEKKNGRPRLLSVTFTVGPNETRWVPDLTEEQLESPFKS